MTAVEEWTDILSTMRWSTALHRKQSLFVRRGSRPVPPLQLSPPDNGYGREVETKDCPKDAAVQRQSLFVKTGLHAVKVLPYSTSFSELKESEQFDEDSLETNSNPALSSRVQTPPMLSEVRSSRSAHETSGRRTATTAVCFSEPNFEVTKKIQPLARFRKAVKTVGLLLKATKTTNRQGQHKELLSWTHYHDDETTAKRTYDLFGISFDPSVFRANREKTISNEAKAILSLYPEERAPEQLKIALLALNQAVDAFSEFPKNMQRSLVRVGWYEHFESKRVIIRQGHMADNFYFILSGTAVVTILETQDDTGEQAVRTVALLKKGNSFGELALMHGARRSATVTCKSNVELLAVGREDFVDIFMHIERDREPEHISFLRCIDLLKGWPIAKLPYDNPKICLFTYFRRGVLLCKDSNNADWIYVIKSGTCRVLKDLLATRPNIPGLELVDYNIEHPFPKLPPIKSPSTSPSSDSPSSSSQDPDSPRSQFSRAGPYSRPRHKKDHSSRALPTLPQRTEEELLASSLEHQHVIDEIFERRHKQTQPDRHRHRTRQEDQDTDVRKRRLEKVFVQIQKLGPKDVFGLEQSVFSMMGNTTGCSLVSDGAECILINKKFFQKHLSDSTAKRVRRTIQPIPTERSLQQKLQDKTNWEAYKSMTLANFIVFRNKLCEYDALYY